jgi:hypothetical protein
MRIVAGRHLRDQHTGFLKPRGVHRRLRQGWAPLVLAARKTGNHPPNYGLGLGGSVLNKPSGCGV